MRHYMNLLESFMLSEGTNYLSMFNDFIGNDDKARATIEKYVSWAKINLKKNDRIVWFLRWVRVELAGKLRHTDSDAEITKVNRRLGTNYARYDLVPVNNLMTNLAHYLSLPIPKIQGVVWGKQSPQGLLQEFKEFEDFWKETSNQRNLIAYQEGDEPTKILEFPDGYVWFDLKQPYCDAEAKAMGHCGNRAAYKRDDTILSLRRLARNVDGQTYWYPVCTFILDGDGELGEMKGRGNDKPLAKYHPYIVALLKLPIIKGIKGGGHAPQNNFNMNDLDEDVKEELIAEKPDLGDVYSMYEKEGMTKRVRQRMQTGLNANGLSSGTYRPDTKDFVVEEWSDFGSFLSSLSDDDVEKIYDIAMGDADFQAERKEVRKTFLDVAQRLPPFWTQKLIDRSGVKNVNDAYSSDDMVIQAANKLMVNGDDWYRTFEEIYHNNSLIDEEAWERLFQYADAGWPFSCSHAYYNIPTQDFAAFKNFVASKQTVELTVPERDMMYYASVDVNSDDDDEHAYDIMRMTEYNSADWSHIDGDYLHEKRREEHLTDSNGKDTWLSGADKMADDDGLADMFIDALTSGTSTKTIHDPRQQDLKFESFRRLLQLAGRRS
jgi:hypothetical protein